MSKASYLQPYGLYLARKYAEAEGFTLEFIQGPRRYAVVARARSAVIWRLAKETDLSLAEIGAIVKKDHTSVLHAIRAENERRDANVRGMQFPQDYREQHRIAAIICHDMNREVVA